MGALLRQLLGNEIIDIVLGPLSMYLLRRLVQAVPTVLGVMILAYAAMTLAPGDPLFVLAGGAGGDPEYFAMMRERYGLDQPTWIRTANYFREMLRGNLGYSYLSHQPVLAAIAERFPATLLLGGAALLFATTAGIGLGTLQARFRNSTADYLGTALVVGGYAIPLFWLGQLLLVFLGYHLGWFPIGGMRSARLQLSGIEGLLDVAWHLILPAFTLGTVHLTIVARLTRASMLEIIDRDYIRTARSKGLRESTVFNKHALRNALLPVITVLGMEVGFLFAGSVLTEVVFSWPGVGRLMYEALLNRDYPLITGVFFVVSLAVVLGNLAADVASALLDPRLRLD